MGKGGAQDFVADATEFTRVGDADYIWTFAAAGDAAVVAWNTVFGEVGNEDIG